MALTYNATITTSFGDTITVDAADGDVMKLSLSTPGLALNIQDASSVIRLLQAVIQAKAADAVLSKNVKP